MLEKCFKMIEILRYYLEIKRLEDLRKVEIRENNLKFDLIKKPDFNLNKFFYKQIGNKHRWIDRLSWSDQVWTNYIKNKNVDTYVLKDNNELAGYFERIFDKSRNEFEIAYFGILNEYRNKKYGGYLLTKALEISLKKDVNRVWVHTCSLDHKNAIQNYLARGMKIYKEEKIKVSA